MDAMPRPRPPYLSREVTRHGRGVWYVRRNGKRIRLRADFGTPDFEAEYQAALAGNPLGSNAPGEGTLAWLIERYRETTAWSHLSMATRRQRENIFLHVLETAGDQPFAKITTATHHRWPRATRDDTSSSAQLPRRYARTISVGSRR